MSTLARAMIISLVTLATLTACGGATADGDPTGMEGDTADCPFPMLHFSVAGADLVAISVNGLPVEELFGAEKSDVDQVEVVTRRGVRFSHLLALAGVEADDEAPVNCIARDNFDPLRSRLQGDTSLLPTLAFFREHAYVYVDSPGEKDPLYPTMEGRSLAVDFDLTSDEEVPAYLGGTLPAINMFRFKMVEMVDETQRGVFEIDPVVGE